MGCTIANAKMSITDTVKFVDEIFATFGPKQEPAPPAPQLQQPPAQAHAPTAQPPQGAPAVQQPLPFNPPLGPSHAPPSYVPPVGAPSQPMGGFDGANYSRKRSYNEGFQGDQEQGGDPHYNNRAFKTPRRGRGNGRMGNGGRDGYQPAPPTSQFPAPPGGFPGMPAGFPPFDQNDPMTAMLALQTMGFPQMPGLPLPVPPAGGNPGQQRSGELPAKSSQRCPLYETQGICYLGATCPYQHGQDSVVVPSKDDGEDPTSLFFSSVIDTNVGIEYDPTNASILDVQRDADGASRGADRGRGRGRGRGGPAPRGRGRAEFSLAGPNEDQSITTIVVEQIPEDKFDEQAIRDFFSQYGNIVEVTMQPYKHLALVKYDSYASAKRAWSSPKVIFDNRFVKVYWYKPSNKPETNGGQQRAPSATPSGAPFDKEEFERQQAEAQRAYEEKMRKRKETEEARQALERQREELLKKQQEEKAKLMQKLAEKGALKEGADGIGLGQEGQTNGHKEEEGKSVSPAADDSNVSEQTKQLRAQLAALEAEAKSLGIDPNAAESGPSYRGRGKGGWPGYRGRGGYMPLRGRGYDPSFSFRGGYRGRGAPFRGRGGVLRLDNRPKRVAVSGVEFNSEKDEALRAYLIVSHTLLYPIYLLRLYILFPGIDILTVIKGIGEYESIEPNPDRPDSQIVTFKDRYIAEKLMYGPTYIPSVGKVELSWVANPPQPTPPTTSADRSGGVEATAEAKKEGMEEDAVMGNTGDGEHGASSAGKYGGNHEVDYDVAEVDDSWGVE